MYFLTSDDVKIHYIDQGPETGSSDVAMIFVPGMALPYMNHICPNTAVHVLGGHMMFYEFPDTFNQILDRFVREKVRI